jgi:hypothetical protein
MQIVGLDPNAEEFKEWIGVAIQPFVRRRQQGEL